MEYTSFRNFVTAARSQPVKAANFSAGQKIAANSASPDLPKEGVVPAVFQGHHLYVKLDLRPGLTTSSLNEDRHKSINLLGELTQAIRSIVHQFDGALLEAQGPVVHAFIPDDENGDAAKLAASAIHIFIEKKIKPSAGTDFHKAVAAICYGPTIFVASVDRHGDNSIVSLAPAANAPAKVLWRDSDRFASGSTLKVEVDGRYSLIRDEIQVSFSTKNVCELLVNASLSLPHLQKESRELSVPSVGSSDSPTLKEPHESFSISIRADMDGFTRKVENAFRLGRVAVMELADEFHEIMMHARAFGVETNAIHLPWAGDCFNLLLANDDRNDYQENRKRKILEILSEFEEHMTASFPNVKWSYSCAGGEIENAQKCNTLISRLKLGDTSLLLATGLPVERSLRGLVEKSPSSGQGVLWKGDVASLDADLQRIMHSASGGENYRSFKIEEIRKASIHSYFPPPKPAYVPHPTTPKTSIPTPYVRPHY